ncbi:hypothetical protein DYBT9275_04769 [Dyadobacter sp. CECT 9275]|uniref:Uncharacterized protein n=1 Tax=Dyadobacter helix TaxID=2822344 RepID=A0A916NDX7_9BACT|nr:hypothetical protein [Dyadobacter sp. CECT 9275]CAG5010597.1 hypothetical protein DYBT9275_04769 [Dyadobacter sp. CECT 9275]
MNYFSFLEKPDHKYKAVLLAFVILLFPFFALSLYVFPTTDDYCHALSVIDMGYFGYQEHYWKTWSGRYIGTLISATQPLAYGSYLGYKLVPMLLFGLYAHAILKFMKAVTMDKLPAWKELLLTFLFMFVLIAELPVVSGYFYWYTGYYYTIADICTLYLFAYLIRNYPVQGTFRMAGLCVALFIIIGMNEYSLVWLVSLTGALFVFGSFVRKRFLINELLLFVVALASGILSITAPGNGARAESGLYPTPLKYNLIYSLKNSLAWSIHNFTKMAPTLCILALVLIPVAAQLYHSKQKGEFRFFKIHPFIALLVFFGTLYLTYFPTYWSIAQPPNLRGQCLINFWTLLGWTFNVFVLTFWVLEKYNAHVPQKLGILSFAVVFYFFSVYCSNFNYRSAWSDLLTGRASRYYSEMMARTQLVSASKDQIVYVPKLKNTPYTILSMNEDTDPAWASVEHDNGCAEWFFKKKFIYK